ncbi:uncharacterized protein LOC121771880 [Salvia splendens]|uniref:uncharacterized protein LOC121771880 n=1 Tax=Salvia splendens TaxID=180675 RepID=UPI001C26AB4F|nr:uncharacterized protein LOC121771880 [Salvia splendens]
MREHKKQNAYVRQIIEDIMWTQTVARICILYMIFSKVSKKRRRAEFALAYDILNRVPMQIQRLNRLVGVTDTDCLVNCRMDRNTFGRLCSLFTELGMLRVRRFVGIEEQVAIFLGVIAHHKKNRMVRFDHWRSGNTVSFYVHEDLNRMYKPSDGAGMAPTAELSVSVSSPHMPKVPKMKRNLFGDGFTNVGSQSNNEDMDPRMGKKYPPKPKKFPPSNLGSPHGSSCGSSNTHKY